MIHQMSRTMRCHCKKRKDTLFQCGHELKVFGFKLGKWGNRWYSNSTYCEKVQNLFETGFFSQNNTCINPVDENDDFVLETNDECVAEVVEMVSG